MVQEIKEIQERPFMDPAKGGKALPDGLERYETAQLLANECLPGLPNLKVNAVYVESIPMRDSVQDGFQRWRNSGLYRITVDCELVEPQRSAEEIGGIQGEFGPSGPKAQQVAESEVGE